MTIRFFVSADEPDKQDLETFFNNLPLIQKHQDLILATPEYANIRIKGCGVFPLYVQTFRLSVGELLRLWAETEWKQDDKYFYALTGSPLSGSNSSAYWSPSKGFGYKQISPFVPRLSEACCLLRTGTPINKSNIIQTEVPVRETSTLNINDLINSIKQ